jgi:hypothetical protein
VKKGKNKFDLSTKRRKRKSNRMVRWAVVSLVGVVAFVGLVYLPFLNLKGVEVAGIEGKEAERMKSLASAVIAEKYYAVLPKSNIVIYPRDEIKGDILKKFPSVKNATVKTSLEGKLLIEVEKREFKSLWCSASIVSKCYLVDQGGLVFAEAAGDLPRGKAGELSGYLKLEGLLTGDPVGKLYGSPDLFNFLLSLSKHLGTLGLSVEKYRYFDQDKAQATFPDGSAIIFTPDPTKSAELVSNLTLFLDDLKSKNNDILPPFKYIDARYGNKIFFKLQ